ncbi:MerR family transcriptional regulator [Ornithinimicrobium cavernae]|uniref:DNA polymerase III subunit beta family protein n=1 Tax=Ornithinimicrobium cavernae TaxID=2666047 RepID=UPI00137A6549|nr:MerR family transcriptional regulator [Ornithinimicrobium cavernae]
MTDPRPEHRLLPIGELSRASGLTVSALRFYDREGLLVPADVDPHTGYRRYSPGQVRLARLLAGMRRVGMPLAEMAAVLAALPDAEVAQDLLGAHLRRLEDGLADARREVERLRVLLPGGPPGTWTAEIATDELARALDSVRYAVGTDPDFPMLQGVLLEPVGQAVRLVATDRYRLALAEARGTVVAPDPAGMPLLAVEDVDRLRRALWEHGEGTVRLVLHRTGFSAELPGGGNLTGECLDLDFPDYRRLLHERPEAGASTRLPVAEILAGLAATGPGGDPQDRVSLSPRGVCGDEQGLLVDRTFLWEAATATGEGHAVLPLGDQIAPLAFHGPDDTLLALLMPVRREGRP